jgi:hypothetical protein
MFEFTGQVKTGNGPHDVWIKTVDGTPITLAEVSIPTNQTFVLSYTATHDEIEDFLSLNPSQKFRLGGASQQDLYITGITVTEIPSLSDGWYYIQATSGLYVHIENASSNNGSKLVLWNGFGDDNTKYYFEHRGNGDYRIKTNLTNRYIEVAGGGQNNGDSIQIGDWQDNQPSLLWRFEKDGDSYRSVNKNSNKVWDIVNNNHSNGAYIKQFQQNMPEAQIFKFIPVV